MKITLLRYTDEHDFCFTLADKKLSCRRDAARCFVSLNISLSHSMSVKVIRN